ncbi:unnamed protein product [Rotaria magnacalcarata]
MKSTDIQKIVETKYENGDDPTKIFRDLAGAVSLPTIKLWIKMINTTGSITLSSPPDCPRTIRTNAAIVKVKNCLSQKKRASTQKLAKDMKISRTSVQRILGEDLGCKPYKKTKQPKLTNLQKKLGGLNEKFFDLDGIYNSQNDRVWTVNGGEVDRKGGFHEKTKYPGKVMVWLGACAEGLTTPIILENRTMDAEVYINEVLPIALESGDRMLGSDWTYQQDGARPHTHLLTQEWCAENFPDFISKESWSPNSPDLCPLDYSLWNELGQCMNWNRMTTKATLIEEIKRSVAKVDNKNNFISVLDFTIRLRIIKKMEKTIFIT